MLPLDSNQLLMSGFSRGVEHHHTKQACAQRCLSLDATDAAALRCVCAFATTGTYLHNKSVHIERRARLTWLLADRHNGTLP